MTMTVVHQVRRKTGVPPEPVGVWLIQNGEARPFYPEQHGEYLPRGRKALMVRPPHVGLEDWIEYKVQTSSSWRLLHSSPIYLLTTEQTSLEAIFRHEHDVYMGKVAALQRSDEHDTSYETYLPGSDLQGEDSVPPEGPSRFSIAQSWWIASELVHRHPELLIHEMHPQGGGDVLCVTSRQQLSPTWLEQRSDAPQVMLNRVGTVQMHLRSKVLKLGDWAHVMGAPTPHTIVKELEVLTGWGPPEKAPPSTPSSLAYRFIAAALTMFMNDRKIWDARNEFIDAVAFIGDEPHARFIDSFPEVMADLRASPKLDIWGEPHSHFWALLRGKEPVVIVSIEGKLYSASGKTVELMAAYEKHDRRITPMTASLLKKWS